MDLEPEKSGLARSYRAALFRLARWRVRAASFLMLPDLSPTDARELRHQVQADGELSQSYVLMCGLSAAIAILGLLQSSTAVVIGAMLISPMMGPIAALGFGFASLDGRHIRDALRVVLIGVAIGVLTGILLTWISPIRNATPEILARTQPTLLDFAVALFSGLAGGYATVIGRGGAAIGVAIATALMPPLATVGYGIGTAQWSFALGAALLFVTNLSAIAFSFALIARLSGAARPLSAVELEPRYVIAGIAAFLALATPLALTLLRVVNETTLRSTTRSSLAAITGPGSTLAQLDITWPMLGRPQVSALVVAPAYAAQAQEKLQQALSARTGEPVEVSLQQVIAVDNPAQTRATIDAAMERTVAGLNADMPPITAIRQSLGLPSRSLWINRGERSLNVEVAAAPAWTLADYRAAEERANEAANGWSVRLVPPVIAPLRISAGGAAKGTVAADLAAWAASRWGMGAITIARAPGEDVAAITDAFAQAGIAATTQDRPGMRQGEAEIDVLSRH